MQLLKQSTSTSVLVGPVLDASGAAVTTAVIGDFNLTKNGSTAAMAAAATATHSHNGHYLIALTTGNTDTLGRLTISANNAAHAMPSWRGTVLVAAMFDALVTNGNVSTHTAADVLTAFAGTRAVIPTNPSYLAPDLLPPGITLTVDGDDTQLYLVDSQFSSSQTAVVAPRVYWDGTDWRAVLADGSNFKTSGVGFTEIWTDLSSSVFVYQSGPSSTALVGTSCKYKNSAASYTTDIADGVISAAKIASDAITASKIAADAGTEIANAVAALDIDGKTLQAALRIIAAIVGGRVSGAGTGTETFKGLDESTTRAVITVDSSGNRTDAVYS